MCDYGYEIALKVQENDGQTIHFYYDDMVGAYLAFGRKQSIFTVLRVN